MAGVYAYGFYLFLPFPLRLAECPCRPFFTFEAVIALVFMSECGYLKPDWSARLKNAMLLTIWSVKRSIKTKNKGAMEMMAGGSALGTATVWIDVRHVSLRRGPAP